MQNAPSLPACQPAPARRTRNAKHQAFLPVPQRPRAEVRRLTEWFTVKFAAEVSTPLIEEKVVKRFLDRAEGGGPLFQLPREPLRLCFLCVLPAEDGSETLKHLSSRHCS